MLLIDDGQTQPLEHHCRLNESMRSNQDVDGAGGQILQNRPPRRALHRPRQQLHPNRHGTEQLPQSFHMLLGQNFSGCHNRCLVTVVLGKER